MKGLMRLTLLFFASLCATIAAAAAERPNILIILADDMGYGDLGCYGSKQIKTPNLDRLAAGGVRCTDGYVAGSVCAPSRAGLMTGRNGSRFGFEHNLSHPDYLKDEYAGIPLDEPLVSDRLTKLGYRTGIIGKWHLGSSVAGHHPNQRGFDHFFGMLGGGHQYFPTAKKNSLQFNGEKVKSIRTPYLTDWFTLEAMDFIQGEGEAAPERAADKEKPWFLYLSYNTPHSPMQAKEEDIERYQHIEPERRRIYCAMQHCMDVNIGKILALLEERGELENTLIVFFSDNGGSVEVSHAVNAPLRGTKGTFLEGGIRVPFIFHWPAAIEPGTYEEPFSLLDLMATFVKAAGGTPPPVAAPGKRVKGERLYDSVDLLPYLTGMSDGAPHEVLFWRCMGRGAAVRQGDWKLLQPNSESVQLYHLGKDISESRDLSAEYPDIVDRLLKLKVDWERTHERNPMFLSAPFWTHYNRRLYEKTFSTEQPEPGDSENIWKFGRPKK